VDAAAAAVVAVVAVVELTACVDIWRLL